MNSKPVYCISFNLGRNDEIFLLVNISSRQSKTYTFEEISHFFTLYLL